MKEKRALLEKNKLKCFAISTHLIGQCVSDDPIDDRHKRVLPPALWGDGKPEGVRAALRRGDEEDGRGPQSSSA